MPTWILALSFWLHMVATVIWVGGLALMALVVWPGARAALGPGPELAELIRQVQRRFNPWAWTSLAVLILLIGGFILVSTGVTGLYIGQIFEQVKARPIFVVDERTGADDES